MNKTQLKKLVRGAIEIARDAHGEAMNGQVDISPDANEIAIALIAGGILTTALNSGKLAGDTRKTLMKC